jgi:hypothetical protein
MQNCKESRAQLYAAAKAIGAKAESEGRSLFTTEEEGKLSLIVQEFCQSLQEEKVALEGKKH